MSNETAQQFSELRDLARHNIEQINRAATGIFEIMRSTTEAFVAPSSPANGYAMDFVRRTLDATEANVGAFCDHALRLAQANSPAECVKLQAEFVRSTLASMQKHSIAMMEAGEPRAREIETTKP